jgi:hypothetical protein
VFAPEAPTATRRRLESPWTVRPTTAAASDHGDVADYYLLKW